MPRGRCRTSRRAKSDRNASREQCVPPIDRLLSSGSDADNAQLAGSHDLLVSIEENALIGGAGSEVARALESAGSHTPLLRLGLPDHFIDHGDSALLLAEAGLDEAGIVQSVTARLAA